MKVAIDIGSLGSEDKVRGVGFYTKHLIESLKKIKTVTIDAVDTTSVDLSKYDVAHYPFYKPYFSNIPNVISTKVVVTVHDVTPLIYPKHYKPGLSGRIKLNNQKKELNSVDAIITDSETSKKDIVRLLGVPQENIHPIHLAPAKHFRPITNQKLLNKTKKKFNLPDRFVLYVGDVNYNKNIPTLIKATKLLKVPLVVVGKQALEVEESGLGLQNIGGPRDWLRYLFNKPHPELAHYQKLLKLFDNGSDVIRLGFIPDEDLAVIYNLAAAYCQPSYYEGFGLPVLEARACGTPVVASKTQTLVEMSENACLFADPNNHKEFASRIDVLMNDQKMRRKLILTSQKLLKEYSWKKTARETLEVYQGVMS